MEVLGISNKDTLVSGLNLCVALLKLEKYEEAIPLARDELLPAARGSLGSEHDITLNMKKNLAQGLVNNPERTRDAPASNHTGTRRV